MEQRRHVRSIVHQKIAQALRSNKYYIQDRSGTIDAYNHIRKNIRNKNELGNMTKSIKLVLNVPTKLSFCEILDIFSQLSKGREKGRFTASEELNQRISSSA